MRKYFLWLIMFSLLTACSVGGERENYLVILSMDGFRWDFPEMADTPNLDSIAKAGVRAEAIRPAFPSKTFPNHYTMATGLYPDNHGIVNNSFYDPETGTIFSMNHNPTRMDPYYYDGEPVWVTAEKQDLRTATLFWVGSEIPIKGIRPSIWKYYEHDLPFEQRIDTLLAWLQLPVAERPRLIMWYLHEPDATGHHHGPESPANMAVVSRLDSLVGIFCRRVRELGHSDKINLIFTSDHGMGATSNEKTVTLTDHVPEEWVELAIGGNPVYNIRARKGYVDSVYYRIKGTENISVWRNGEVPADLNYGNNPRTLDLIVAADSSWSVNWSAGQVYSGTHGYDIRQRDMQAIFYATGPAFRKGHVHPVFDNVDLYPLIANILGIIPEKTDGDIEKTRGMLVK